MELRFAPLLLLVGATGCANVIGLNALEEVPCVGAACADDSSVVDTQIVPDTSDSATTETSDDTSIVGDVEQDTSDTSVELDTGSDVVDSTVTDSKSDVIVDTKVDSIIVDTKVDTKVDTMVPDTCTVSCDTLTSVGALCMGATCAYSDCKAGFANCDTTAPDTNGCETNATTTLNCGGCGNVCNPVNASTASCTAGACSYSCKSGFADCDKSGGNTNGCETPLNTLTNCGACGAKCDTVRSTGASCAGTTCTYSGCNTGWANCDTSGTDANGCESAVDSNVDNCGSCGRACASTNVSSKSCSGGACNSSCNAGFANCNKPATGADDGCECATPGCCAGGCAVTHKNGTSAPLGQSYWLSADYCKAVGTPGDATTYTADMANAAAAAWPGAGAAIDAACGTAGRIICKGGADGWASWGYTGTIAGHVYWQATGCGGPTKCCCPFATDPTWN